MAGVYCTEKVILNISVSHEFAYRIMQEDPRTVSSSHHCTAVRVIIASKMHRITLEMVFRFFLADLIHVTVECNIMLTMFEELH